MAMSAKARSGAILLDDVLKVYRVYRTPIDRLRRVVGLRPRFRETVALEAINLEISSGEAVGIIGDNGAGKSTLMKLVAGTTAATRGSVYVDGRLSSILELGAGFHPEFSGRENALLYGALVGLVQDEMDARLPSILAFSELGDFIDDPVKTYSTGMTMRLAFAVATHVDPDILVVDEALAVGDGYFQKKCIDRLMAIKEGGATILFCSHAMYYVTQFCDRAVWLRNGRVEQHGNAKDVVEAYEAYLLNREKRRVSEPKELAQPQEVDEKKAGRITRVRIADEAEGEAEALDPGDSLEIEVRFESSTRDQLFHLGIAIDSLDGRCVLGMTTQWDGCRPLGGRDRYLVRLRVPSFPVATGSYHLSAFLLDETGLVVHDQVVEPDAIRINPPEWTPSLLMLAHEWDLEQS